MEKSKFNGANSNYIPDSPVITPLPEMDYFEVEETDNGPVVVRKKSDASVDLGDVDAYSLRSLKANNIDPASLNIHTSSVSRLDGMSSFDKFSSAADKVLSPEDNSTSENSNN